MKIIDKVNTPKDLKSLDKDNLLKLSEELRQIIIETVSKNGGHLASNLGVVEMTIALMRIFNFPEDKIIWDVGHQCYTYKILTERKSKIKDIRCKDGLTGYPDIYESSYDCVNTGHASTSVPIASGMAVAKKHLNKDNHIVAVIGDGALTGGVALEALNHIGQIKQKVIIILNDNKMSISPNVGGISKHLNYIASGRPYIRLKEGIQSVLKCIPMFGQSMIDTGKKVETLMRTMMAPGTLFDELGVKYTGPIDGHNIDLMEKTFEEAKEEEGPVLIHIVTAKGFGYKPALDDPSSFHSSAPFTIEDGKFIKSGKIPSYSKIFGQTLLKLIEKDKKIITLTAAMPGGTGLDMVQKKFPDNFYDVGIAEQYMLDFAAGLSLEGLKPICSIYSTFLQRAYDQVIHDLSLMKIPVVIGIDRAGLVGGDGATHQGLLDQAILSIVDNIKFLSPKDENELQHMIYTAYKKQECPTFIRYPKEPGQGVKLDEELKLIELDKPEILREGKNGLLIGFGPIVNNGLQAAQELYEKDQISLTVVNLRCLNPFPKEEILELLKRHKKIITLEDAYIEGGLGSKVSKILCEEKIRNNDFLGLAVEDIIISVASRNELLEKYGLSAKEVYSRCKAFLNLKTKKKIGLLRSLLMQ